MRTVQRTGPRPVPRPGERGGATSVEMALLWGVMTLLFAAVVQAALVFWAGQLAATAAQEGVRDGRISPAAPVGDARAGAEAFLVRVDSPALSTSTVTSSYDAATGTVQVQVTGTALSLVPGAAFTVTRDAAGALEQVSP